MSLSSIEFFIAEAWTGFRRSGIMSLVAIGTITVSLVIFGVFLTVVLNMNNLVSSIGSKMEVVAYVNSNLDEWTINKLQVEMNRLPGVGGVKFISKDEAWREFKADYQEKLDLEGVIKENPLPNAFVLRLENPKDAPKVAKQISSFTIIDEVRYSGKLAEKIELLSSAVRFGGLVLVLLLGLATLLIVVNTIRLTVLARQTDITIMKLVGATDAFIKWPFIIEGIIIGVIGSALSFILLKFSYDTVIVQVQNALPFLPLVVSQRELWIVYALVVTVGIFLGMFGGYISVSKSLKEQI